MYRSYRREREKDIKNVLSRWQRKTGLTIKSHAQRNAPKGATHDLAKSIQYYHDFPASIVAVNMPYAHFVEGYPRVVRRHFTPWSVSHSFQRWGKQRGYDTSRGGLLTWGYNIPFFRSAIDTAIPSAMASLRTLHL